MTREIKSFPITDSVNLTTFTDTRFKTMRLSVDMAIPLSELTAAKYGILPSLISRASREYPDYTALSRRLSELYGASLNSCVRKIGEYQVLTLSASGISSRYALEGENMFQELSDLLFSVLFHPLKDGTGCFPEEGFLQEQRQLMELMDTEFNDKILYTHRRCEETLFAGMPAGINRYGSREEIAALHREELSAAWEELLKNARFEIFALGDCQPDPALFRKRFSGFGKPLHGEYLPFSVPRQQKRGEEKMPLSQSKLSLAFRADLQPEERLLFQLANAVWGGTPSSKLFQNVREKQSLCYYCSSALDAPARTLYVESGVEQENLGRAEEEINRQLSLLQAGQVTEEELQAAKLALRNSLQSIGDSLSAVENWCVSRMFDNFLTLPQQAVETLMGYTLDDVISAARRIFPAAAFCLKGMNTP